MKKETLISVIVPVYKVESFLERCVKSITSQTYHNLEIILIDDGSPDNCPKMCDEFKNADNRIKVIHKQNSGVSSARNDALKIASGKYVAFVDSDDWIEPNMYEEMVSCAEKEDADLVFCRVREAYDDGTFNNLVEENLDKIKNKEIKYLFCNARKGCRLANLISTPWRTLYKKEIVDGLKFNESLKYGEDLYFVLDAIEKSNKISVCDKYLYNYFKNTNSVCNSINDSYFANTKKFHEHSKKYIKQKNLDFEYLINHLYLYRNVINKASQNDFEKIMKDMYENDEDFKNCFKKENYKKIQKLEIGLKQKIRNFLMYHKMWKLFKILANKK